MSMKTNFAYNSLCLQKKHPWEEKVGGERKDGHKRHPREEKVGGERKDGHKRHPQEEKVGGERKEKPVMATKKMMALSLST